MANINAPHGFTFAYTLHGGPPTVQHMPVGSCTEVFNGDIVMTTTTGIMPKACGDAWDPYGAGAAYFVVGVAGGYSKTGTSSTIPVYTDLRNTVFKVQVSTTTLTFKSSDAFVMYDCTWVAGSTLTGLSKAQINGTTATTLFGARVLGHVDDPNFSTEGGYQEVYVHLAVPGDGGLYAHAGATSD